MTCGELRKGMLLSPLHGIARGTAGGEILNLFVATASAALVSGLGDAGAIRAIESCD
jgi:hypothetical protein